MRERDFHELSATSFAETRERLADNLARVVRHYGGLAITQGFSHKGVPTAVFGAIEPWPGSWSAWMVATDDWPKVALSATRHIKSVTLPSVWREGAHRIEARSVARYVQAHRWMQLLGAREEAVLRGYGRHGEDFKVFVWRRHV